jgi:hypothetical protein
MKRNQVSPMATKGYESLVGLILKLRLASNIINNV